MKLSFFLPQFRLFTFPLAVPPATPIRKGFFRSPLMSPPMEDEGDTRTGEFPLDVLLERRSMLSNVDKKGRCRKFEQKRCFATTFGERLKKVCGLQAGKTRENDAAAILEEKKQVLRRNEFLFVVVDVLLLLLLLCCCRRGVNNKRKRNQKSRKLKITASLSSVGHDFLYCYRTSFSCFPQHFSSSLFEVFEAAKAT